MKHHHIVAFSAFFALCAIHSMAQTCIPTTILFSTQQQVDDFSANYPGCAVIEGNVGFTGHGITNLDGLLQLNEIRGSVLFSNMDNLAALNGLTHLTAIGGFLRFEDLSGLTNIDGLHSLAEIGDNLEFAQAYGLEDLDGLNSLTTIGGNFSIADFSGINAITGLNNLQSIGGYCDLQGLNDVSGLANLDSIGMNFYLAGSNGVLDMAPLNQIEFIGTDISLNGQLTNLGLFQNLDTIYGSLILNAIDNVSDLSGFENVTCIFGDLQFSNNNVLVSISGFDNLDSIGQSLSIQENMFLSDLSGLDHSIKGINNISVTSNSFLSQCDVQAICDKVWLPNIGFFFNNNGPGCSLLTDVQENCPQPLDTDGDGVYDSIDNCPMTPNPYQTDQNGNGIGDACEDLPGVGINTENPLKELHLSNSSMYIDNPEKGIIFKDYSGNCFVFKIVDGATSVSPVPCPE